MVDELYRQIGQHRHDIRPILGFVGILAGAALINALFTYGARRVQSFLGARVSMDIRVTLYNKFNQLSLGYYDKRSTGTVMSRITNDSEQIWDFLAEGLPWLVSNSVGTGQHRDRAVPHELVAGPADACAGSVHLYAERLVYAARAQTLASRMAPDLEDVRVAEQLAERNAGCEGVRAGGSGERPLRRTATNRYLKPASRRTRCGRPTGRFSAC